MKVILPLRVRHKYPVSLLASSFQNLQTSDSVLALFPLLSEFYLLNPLYAQSLNLLDSLLRVMEKQKLPQGSRSLAFKKKVLPVPLRTDK